MLSTRGDGVASSLTGFRQVLPSPDSDDLFFTERQPVVDHAKVVCRELGSCRVWRTTPKVVHRDHPERFGVAPHDLDGRAVVGLELWLNEDRVFSWLLVARARPLDDPDRHGRVHRVVAVRSRLGSVSRSHSRNHLLGFDETFVYLPEPHLGPAVDCSAIEHETSLL